MRLLILAAALIAATPATAEPKISEMPVVNPNASAPANCPPISRYDAARRGSKLGAQHLDELPAADLYKAVYRTVGGCVVPVIAGYGYGLPRKDRR